MQLITEKECKELIRLCEHLTRIDVSILDEKNEFYLQRYLLNKLFLRPGNMSYYFLIDDKWKETHETKIQENEGVIYRTKLYMKLGYKVPQRFQFTKLWSSKHKQNPLKISKL